MVKPDDYVAFSGDECRALFFEDICNDERWNDRERLE
jgi:hypothetical protein